MPNCNLCQHKCNIDRTKSTGRCRANDTIKIALSTLHHFEEPCISGTNGSGTIFFFNCNLSCMYCQNHEISQTGKGQVYTIEQLAELMLEQQQNQAENVNLVTPTIYADKIIEAIKIARREGLQIPIVYNTSTYETVETIQKLNGYIDVYLPDLKYYNDEIAKAYSHAGNYFQTAAAAIQEMYKQVGPPVLDNRGMIRKGLIIRHLVLPNHVADSKKILKWINDTIDQEVYVSVMAQYFPTYLAKDHNKLNRKLSRQEYEQIENYLYSLNLDNGYIQELGEHEEEYVPNFNLPIRNNS